jgi:hypothetical protein
LINIPNEDIKIEKEVASGGFGIVYQGTLLSTSELIAVKEMKNHRLPPGAWHQ